MSSIFDVLATPKRLKEAFVMCQHHLACGVYDGYDETYWKDTWRTRLR